MILTLYKHVLKIDLENPQWEERDRFVLSKGHCSLALYAVLEEIGFLNPGELDTYTMKGSRLAGHVEHFEIPAIEMTTGFEQRFQKSDNKTTRLLWNEYHSFFTNYKKELFDRLNHF
jgi:hypothetical protein